MMVRMQFSWNSFNMFIRMYISIDIVEKAYLFLKKLKIE
jgi:hypothetical protein